MRKMIFVSGAFAVGIASGIAVVGPAIATPPCQTNWELKSDGLCHPYYSTGGGPHCYPNPDPNGDSYTICDGSS